MIDGDMNVRLFGDQCWLSLTQDVDGCHVITILRPQ